MTSIPEGDPCVNGGIELFHDSKSGKVPEGAVEVIILKAAANCDRLVGGDTVVIGVYTISPKEST